MRCPYCQEPESKVIDSRSCEDGFSIRRCRECGRCKRRFTTYERMEEKPLLVIKKGGDREPFDRNKLFNGITRACVKRPISIDDIEKLVSAIELELRDINNPEVTTKEIGEMIMDRLRSLDEVAYVRFASVYRQFSDINGFINTIDQLKNK